ncbi:hypothetical protein [Flagellimonas amoyensis]|uniref:hypothetical protein n=1 Tax=Flagellimonas amoyensis TaxID=2169401 RepID=UPI000D373D8A|nr:hypothetical protein [Allomuricauda amoyensis]
MSFAQKEIDELKKVAPDLKIIQEGGYTFFYIEKLLLPDGCVPNIIEALLCPTPHSGYPCRLFFSSQISGCPARNWNGNLRVIGRNWFAISWKTKSGLTLLEMVSIHLKALER